MIASLHGHILAKNPNSIVIDVGGVGYSVNVTPQLSASVDEGQEVTLQTRLVVREDSMTVFGFETPEEIELFDLVTSVSGIGPKLGLAILASLSVDAIRQAVATESDATFKSVPGIGPKTAKLIVVTLAGKLQTAAAAKGTSSDVLVALIGLGYAEKQALGALSAVGSEGSTSEVLRRALAELSGTRGN